MAIKINYPDKILPGVWQSYTISSDEGEPRGEVVLEGKALEQRIIHMRDPLWKVTFFLPPESGGGKLTLKFQNSGSQVEDTKEVLSAG